MSISSAFGDVFVYISIFGFFFLVLKKLLDIARVEIDRPRPLVKPDDFYKEFGYSYDFVLVFRVYTEAQKDELSTYQKSHSLKNIIILLQKAGLEYSCFFSCQRDEIYVKIRLSPARIRQEADRVNYLLLLDRDKLKIKAQTGKTNVWKKLNITDEYQISIYEPWDYIYAAYRLDPEIQTLYKQYEADDSKEHPFRGVDRIKILLSIMEAKKNQGGCGLHITQLLVKDAVLAAFPLHDYDKLSSLQNKWLQMYDWPSNQPLDDIKDYFGERIGLYFAFLGYYDSALFVPAIFGLVTYIVQKVFVGAEFPLMPAFATFMVLWAVVFVEYWKQKQITLAMMWGVIGFEDQEQDRPQFKGIIITSPIDGKTMTYFKEDEKTRRHNLVMAAIGLSILIVLLVVTSTFVIQWVMNQPENAKKFTILGVNTSTIITPILNAVVIGVLNVCYQEVVYRLNNYENHRTDTDYEDNLVGKVFVFQLVNSFAALTYVSFVKTFLGIKCSFNNCTIDVATTLSTVFISRLVVQVIVEVFVRKFLQYKKDKEETEGLEPGVKQSPIESQYVFAEYDALIGAMTDYAGLVIQYGYTILFVAAFPLAPTLAFVMNYIQIRIDGWKLCQAHRRPIPKSAEDIGMWQDMISILSTLGVVYNFGLIFFTGHYFINIQWQMRWILFILAEHACFFITVVLELTIDDVPDDVKMQLQRQEFLVRKVIFDEKDDAGDELQLENSDSSVNIVIESTDLGWCEVINEEEEEEGKAPTKDYVAINGGTEAKV